LVKIRTRIVVPVYLDIDVNNLKKGERRAGGQKGDKSGARVELECKEGMQELREGEHT
jgi:hypothetical protein